MTHIRFTTAKVMLALSALFLTNTTFAQLNEEQERKLSSNLQKIELYLLNPSTGQARVNSLIDPMLELGNSGITLNQIQSGADPATETSSHNPRTRSRDTDNRLTRPTSSNTAPSLLEQRAQALRDQAAELEAKLEPFLKEMNDNILPALTERMDSYEFWQNIENRHRALMAFDAFCGFPSTSAIVEQSQALYEDTRNKRQQFLNAYSAGDFHQSAGSGIYLTQKDHISPEALSADDTTSNIVIDGNRPVHIFVLTDFPVELYSDSPLGCFVQLALTDPDDGQYSSNYIVDGKAAAPVTTSGKAYVKLTLVPSGNWEDFADQFDPSQFYDGNLQTRLAETLEVGKPRRFKIYSANGQLSKEITITATQAGIDFLKSYHEKLEKYIIDGTRLDPAAVSDSGMEAKINQQFLAKHPGVKIARTVITLKPWYVTKNALGTPLYRDFYAQIAYSDGSGKYYMQKLYCKSNYNGSGYDAMKVSERTGPKEMRQENVFK